MRGMLRAAVKVECDSKRAFEAESFEDSATKFTRITVNPKQMDGVPCIRGLRIPVATVVGLIADGMTQAQILKAYPDLEAADINEACNTPPRRSESANCP